MRTTLRNSAAMAALAIAASLPLLGAQASIGERRNARGEQLVPRFKPRKPRRTEEDFDRQYRAQLKRDRRAEAYLRRALNDAVGRRDEAELRRLLPAG